MRNSKLTTVVIHKSVWQQLTIEAARQGKKRTVVLEDAVMEYLEKRREDWQKLGQAL